MRLSHDLHDHLAQDLSAIKIGCELLFDDLPEISPIIRERFLKLSKMLQEAIITVRDLTYNLRPPLLDQFGLAQTLFQYCEDFGEKNRITIDFKTAGMEGLRLDFNTEINLYRLVQESLNNVKKHAAASRVIIRLVISFPNIILRVEDNGKGFNVREKMGNAISGKHLGIQGMKERTGLLNGKINIRSNPGEGTKIFIEMPWKEKNDEQG